MKAHATRNAALLAVFSDLVKISMENPNCVKHLCSHDELHNFGDFTLNNMNIKVLTGSNILKSSTMKHYRKSYSKAYQFIISLNEIIENNIDLVILCPNKIAFSRGFDFDKIILTKEYLLQSLKDRSPLTNSKYIFRVFKNINNERYVNKISTDSFVDIHEFVNNDLSNIIN